MKFAIALFVWLITLSIHAQMNGAQILHDCTELTSTKVPSELESINSGHCIGIIRGVSDTLMMWEIIDTKHSADAYHGCIPPEVSVSQAIAVVRKYLTDHPEKLHLGDSVLVRVALVEAFPCRRN